MMSADGPAMVEALPSEGDTSPANQGATVASPTLVLDGLQAVLSGFVKGDFACETAPERNTGNPIHLDVHLPGGDRKFTLWCFRIEGGGGGPTVRPATERRIQESNGPETIAAMTDDGRIPLLIGHAVEEDVLCIFDQRYIRDWVQKYQDILAKPQNPGDPKPGKPSPSRQVTHDQLLGLDEETIRTTERTAPLFTDGKAVNYVMKPAMLPKFLGVVKADGTYDGADLNATASAPITDIVEYCKANKYHFDPDLIARYVASLAAKPFVILAGISGTGKSKLAELVAEFYARGPGGGSVGPLPTVRIPGRTFTFAAPGTPPKSGGSQSVALVPVRPDWLDNKSVLGFVNPITDTYESTATLDIILRATASPDDRHFLILDEMNLAKVEHYFSDWLACTESRRYRTDNTVHQQGVALHRSAKRQTTLVREANGSDTEFEVPGSLMLPVNLAVTGTVNVDESTHGFSPKVLDRAMVLEFDDVDLDGLRDAAAVGPATGVYNFPSTLPAFRLATAADYAAMPPSVHAHLVAINGILEKPRLHVGYRAATEMALFMRLYNEILPATDVDADWLMALDAAVLQKILPRIGGNRVRLEKALALLCHYLRDLGAPAATPVRTDYAEGDDARLGKSYRRALEMWDTLIEFGYVSFFK